MGTSSDGVGRFALYNPGSSGGDSTYVKDKGLYVRNDAGPTHVNLSGVDNFTLRLHNGAYAGSGIADPQGSISKILFHGVSHNGWNNYAAICMDVQGTSAGRGELVFLTGGDTTSTKERIELQEGEQLNLLQTLTLMLFTVLRLQVEQAQLFLEVVTLQQQMFQDLALTVFTSTPTVTSKTPTIPMVRFQILN